MSGKTRAALAGAALLAAPGARAQTPGGPATLPEIIRPGPPTLPPGAGGDTTTTQPRGDSIVPPGGTVQPLPDPGLTTPLPGGVVAPPSAGQTPVIRPPSGSAMPVIPPSGTAR